MMIEFMGLKCFALSLRNESGHRIADLLARVSYFPAIGEAIEAGARWHDDLSNACAG